MNRLKIAAILMLSAFIIVEQVSAADIVDSNQDYSVTQKNNQNTTKNHLADFALTALTFGFAAKVLKDL